MRARSLRKPSHDLAAAVAVPEGAGGPSRGASPVVLGILDVADAIGNAPRVLLEPSAEDGGVEPILVPYVHRRAYAVLPERLFALERVVKQPAIVPRSVAKGRFEPLDRVGPPREDPRSRRLGAVRNSSFLRLGGDEVLDPPPPSCLPASPSLVLSASVQPQRLCGPNRMALDELGEGKPAPFTFVGVVSRVDRVKVLLPVVGEVDGAASILPSHPLRVEFENALVTFRAILRLAGVVLVLHAYSCHDQLGRSSGSEIVPRSALYPCRAGGPPARLRARCDALHPCHAPGRRLPLLVNPPCLS